MPGEIVSQFIRTIEHKDLEGALAYLADDVEYDNVPIGKSFGVEGVRTILGPFLARYDEVDWKVHHQTQSGTTADGVVMNERTDRFRSGDQWVEIPLMGLFLVREGKIAVWRDYFDLGQLRAAQSAPAS